MAGVSKFPQLSVAKATHGMPIALKSDSPWTKPYQSSWQGNKTKEPCVHSHAGFPQAYRAQPTC